jgi:hypothetical protein
MEWDMHVLHRLLIFAFPLSLLIHDPPSPPTNAHRNGREHRNSHSWTYNCRRNWRRSSISGLRFKALGRFVVVLQRPSSYRSLASNLVSYEHISYAGGFLMYPFDHMELWSYRRCLISVAGSLICPITLPYSIGLEEVCCRRQVLLAFVSRSNQWSSRLDCAGALGKPNHCKPSR